MAMTMRSSSFLPTIKCSSCARDIEIAMMGDHVCEGPAPASEPTPPPESDSNFRMPYQQPYSHGSSFLKPARTMPPKVDTSAANRPYYSQDQLTPASASPSRSASPRSPINRLRSPFGQSSRSNSPIQLPIQRPPSREQLSSNLDSAFPRFPSPKPSKQRAKQKGTFVSLSPKNYGDYQADKKYTPANPKITSSSALQNTITPGPYGVDATRGREPTRDLQRQAPTTAADFNLSSTITSSPTEGIDENPMRYGAATSTHNSSDDFPVRRKNGYGGFGPSAEDHVQERPVLDTRSLTFPRRKESLDFSRKNTTISPTVPIGRGPSLRRSGSRAAEERGRKMSSSGPDTSRPLPPRGASLIRGRAGKKAGDVPPLPGINLDAEFGASNPYHTSTDSRSSNNSVFSEVSRVSSRSTPSVDHSRKLSAGGARLSDLMSELTSSMSNLSPHDSYSRSTELEPVKEQEPFSPLRSGFQTPTTDLTNQSRLFSAPARGPSPAPLKQIDRRPSPAPMGSHYRDLSPAPLNQRSHTAPLLPTSEHHKPLPPRPSTSKGNCKSCTLPIKGKSISSADGRLTGRYHKPCFVCTTCRSPFPSSEFYVLDDKPYCEFHYHFLNESLCVSCDHGIEGQYLESEKREKFHPGCLNCTDCGRNLRHDYFEMPGGGIFCERDAFRRAQEERKRDRERGVEGGLFGGGGLAAPTTRMERRTTRLMMM